MADGKCGAGDGKWLMADGRGLRLAAARAVRAKPEMRVLMLEIVMQFPFRRGMRPG
jgi:hypothetical protein